MGEDPETGLGGILSQLSIVPFAARDGHRPETTSADSMHSGIGTRSIVTMPLLPAHLLPVLAIQPRKSPSWKVTHLANNVRSHLAVRVDELSLRHVTHIAHFQSAKSWLEEICEWTRRYA